MSFCRNRFLIGAIPQMIAVARFVNGFKKSITLSRATGAVTNYQMKLLVGESSGATGEDVDCGGHCLTSFNDLRFRKADGVTELDYWIESITGTTPNQLATVWIEFDSIGTGATTFYMFYGGVDVASVSNGANTFLFFDHFDGDLSKWSGDTASASIASSICTLVGDSGGKAIYGAAQTGDLALRIRANLPNANYGQIQFAESTAWANCVFIDHNDAMTNHSRHTTQTGGGGTTISNVDLGFGSYHIYDLTRSLTGTDTARTFTDNVQNGTGSTNNVPTGNLFAGMRAINVGTNILCDWILIRQYIETEPAWGSWGVEETL